MEIGRKSARAAARSSAVSSHVSWRGWLLLCSALALAGGCGSHEVSPLAYEYAKALYSATNRQDREGLERIQDQLTQLQSDGSLSTVEAGWLSEITQDAAAGDWHAANGAARKIMEDQVKSE